jgi:hypothetical protein
MLFLGLGTGLGSAMIVDGVLQPMELGHLPYRKGKTFEDYVGAAGMKRLGKKNGGERSPTSWSVLPLPLSQNTSSWAVATPKSSNIFRVGHGAERIKALLSADSDFGKLTQSAIDQRGEDEGPGVEEIQGTWCVPREAAAETRCKEPQVPPHCFTVTMSLVDSGRMSSRRSSPRTHHRHLS